MYCPEIRTEELAKVIDSLKIDVIANGNVFDEESAKLLLEKTNAKGVLQKKFILSNEEKRSLL